jgi:hypothetical protein
MCVKFSEPGRVISDNPLFGHSQPIRGGLADDPQLRSLPGVGTGYELRASDVLPLAGIVRNTRSPLRRRPKSPVRKKWKSENLEKSGNE